jgi:thiol-disulfide isomerase/thioredoxin
MKHLLNIKNLVLLLLLGIAIMNVSAVKRPIRVCKLSGTIKGAYNGEKVYLSKYYLPDTGYVMILVNVDSAIIKNGKYIFKNRKIKKTTLDMPMIVRYTHNHKTIIQYPVILENTNIVMYLDTAGKGKNNKVTGSPKTESIIEYSKGVNKYLADKVGMDKMKKFVDIHNNAASTPEMQEKAMDILKEYNHEQKKYAANFICCHIPSWISNYLLVTYYSDFDKATKDSVMAVMKTKWPNNSFIKKQIAQEKYENEEHAIQNRTPVGSDYKDLAMKDTLGMPMKISDYVPKNKVTLVDFWASWCGPCRREIPNIIKLYNQYKDKGLGVISISFDERSNDWKGAINDLHLPWPQMSDLKGWKSEGAKVYGIMGIPYTLLIDQNGKILAKGLRSEELATKLSEILK